MATCKDDCLYSPVCRKPFNTSETQVDFAEVCRDFKNKADFVEISRVKEMLVQIKCRFYYHFEEIIPSVMSDEIDEIFKEFCGGVGDEQTTRNPN